MNKYFGNTNANQYVGSRWAHMWANIWAIYVIKLMVYVNQGLHMLWFVTTPT